jgi:hypothetical protein
VLGGKYNFFKIEKCQGISRPQGGSNLEEVVGQKLQLCSVACGSTQHQDAGVSVDLSKDTLMFTTIKPLDGKGQINQLVTLIRNLEEGSYAITIGYVVQKITFARSSNSK